MPPKWLIVTVVALLVFSATLIVVIRVSMH
jgi:Sec-independent protein translocase protein TatA